MTRDINPSALETIEIEIKSLVPARHLGFGLAFTKSEGTSYAFDGDGIPIVSVSHPYTRKVSRWRLWLADRLVSLAETVGDKIFYGRMK